MKARHIRKIRKELRSYKAFSVSCYHYKNGKFGEERIVIAKDSLHALHRFATWYWRRHKELPPYYAKNRMFENTSNSSNFVVTDSKGFKYYYL